jgi:hypothetical protein
MFLTRKKKKEKIIQSFELLGWLLATGLNILDSIQLLGKFSSMLNTYYYPHVFQRYEKYRFLEKIWFHIEDGIIEGKTLSECVKEHKLIDAEIVNRIVKGEDNGNLPITLIQIDRDEIDEEEIYSQYRDREASDIDSLVDRIIENAFNQKAKKIAFPSLPDGETSSGSELDDKKSIMENTFPIYFQIEGKWHLHDTISSDYLSQTINRLLLMSGLQYWKKSESEGVIKFKKYGSMEAEIKVHYSPESQRILLNIIKMRKLTSKS